MSHVERPYQSKLVADILTAMAPGAPVVLAADVGAGKTDISFTVIAALLATDPRTRVFIVTHNRKDIRKQYADRLVAATIRRNDRWHDVHRRTSEEFGVLHCSMEDPACGT
jgi:superfamily II DNA or RNA helicase